MRWVTKHLAFGNSREGLNEKWLVSEGFTAALNVAWDLHQPIYDAVLGKKAGLIAGPGNTLEQFTEAVDLALKLLAAHHKVLIYGHSGVVRAPSVAAAALSASDSSDVAVNALAFAKYPDERVESTFIRLLKNWQANKGSDKPLVSIVMPCYNNLHLTKRCVSFIKRNTSYPSYEIVGVNDGSTEEGVGEYLEKNCDRVVTHEEREGVASCRADGNDAAKGDMICQIDNDIVVFPQWLTNLVDTLTFHEDEHRVKIVAPLLSCLVEYTIYHDKGGIGRGCVQVEEVGGACMLYRKNLLEEIGNFDTSLNNVWEDKDFCFRVTRGGKGRIFVDPRVIVYHCGWVDPKTGLWSGQGNTRSLPEVADDVLEKETQDKVLQRWKRKR